MRNRLVSGRDRKTATDVTCSGRDCSRHEQRRLDKLGSPTVDSRVLLTVSDEDELRAAVHELSC